MTGDNDVRHVPKPRPKRLSRNSNVVPIGPKTLPPEPTAKESAAKAKDQKKKFREAVEDHKFGIKVARTARAEVEAEAFDEPDDDGSLDDQFRDPAPAADYLIGPAVMPARGIVQFNAQWKAGKTSLTSVNLACDVASGRPFLGEYPINFPEGAVAIWNFEVAAGTLQRWMFARGLDAAARARVHPKHLVGRTINLTVPAHADWAAGWPRERGVRVWIIDPLSKLYTGKENDATEFNEWWRALGEIQRLAEVDLVVIVHHTGHGTPGEGDAMPRGRGSSAMMGNPDVSYSYRHAGALGSEPPPGDDRRYLRGFGRDVDFPEVTVEFDPLTHTLSLVRDSKGRADDAAERNARRVAEVVWAADGPLKTGDLKDALSTMRNESKVSAIARAVSEGWVSVRVEGVAKWHERGETDPNKFDFKLGAK